MFSSWIRRGAHHSLRRRCRLAVERLEDRWLPAVFWVTTTADNVTNSLRWAIQSANNNSGPDTIDFSIGSGSKTITPASALPTITDAVSIVGGSQPGYGGSPIIVLNGASSGQAAYDGLTITASNCVIRDLVINRFANGITITGSGATGNLVTNCLIGTNVNGNGAQPNSQNGVQIINSSNNSIGSTVPAEWNLISGNNGSGVVMSGSGATGNIVQNDVIGLNLNQGGALANGNDGVDLINGANHNTVGGTTTTEQNYISGNAYEGVWISDPNTSANLVIGNLIGTDGSGTKAIANKDSGVGVQNGAHNNTVGGTASGDANVISGNSYEGVYLQDAGTTGNAVLGNLIGLDITGTKAVANKQDGLDIVGGASDNTVGGTATGAGNVISGNTQEGVWLSDAGTARNIVLGNIIGLNEAATAKVANGKNGVEIYVGAVNNTIGGSAAGTGNIISGNSGEGVYVTGNSTSRNVIQGNWIGSTPSGTSNLGNGARGIWINGAPNNLIGGPTAIPGTGAGNVIADDGSDPDHTGLLICNSGATGNLVQGNYIAGNTGRDIRIGDNANDNTIGGTAAGDGNALAASNKDGIDISNWNGSGSSGPAGLDNAILRNSIYNTPAGYLSVWLNGGNQKLSPPVLSLAGSSNGQTTVIGSLTGPVNTTFALEFFASDGNSPPQTETYLTYDPQHPDQDFSITTDGSGFYAFTAHLAGTVAAGQYVTATATASLPGGHLETSSVSAPVLADTVPPTSSVAALPAYNHANFTVKWSGSDNAGGSGLWYYDIYVSDNGGAYTHWLTSTGTSATFTGQNGHTYAFYSIATDNAWNVESAPTTPDATTLVDVTPPTSQVAALPSFEPGSFRVSWSGSDGANGSGIAYYDEYYSTDGGHTFVNWLHATTQTSATFTSAFGGKIGFYSVATDNAGNVQPMPNSAQATTVIDVTAPTSKVTALPVFSQGSYAVSWSGADNAGGSGIAYYDVYVSENGGSYTAWQTHTTATSATFTGSNGHTYSFYSVATDNVGNVQPTPAAAQASTQVDTVAPTSSVGGLAAFSPGSFAVSWSGNDDPGGSGVAGYTVYVSDDGGALAPWLTNTTSTSAVFTGVDGHSYGFYSIATDNAGNVEPTPSAPEAVTTDDAAAPTSTAAPLPQFSDPSFTVSWSGSDGGSGIAYYDVYVSDNGGPFTPWLTHTTPTAASYSGQDGHTYAFYSVATDIVGNHEATPNGAQATTTADGSGPTSRVTLPAFSLAAFTVHWSGSDSKGSGIAYYDIYVSVDGGAFAPLLLGTTLTSTSYTGVDGHSYGFYSVATDNVGNQQPTPSAAQATTTVDTDAPTGTVAALPTYSPGKFQVVWSGSDGAGSEIAHYDVYVSDNGGPFTTWLTGATVTSATYTGQDGHTYGFYSVATDSVGNVQPTPSAVQASTVVDAVAPTSSMAPLPASMRPTAIPLDWSGQDNAGGSGLAGYNIYVSDNSGPFTAWLTNTTQTSATYTGQDGHSYAFYSLAIDNAGNIQSAATVIPSTTLALPADHLVVNVPAQAIAGGNFTATVVAADPNGFADGLYNGSAALSLVSGPAGGKLSGTLIAALHNGVAAFSNLSLNNVGGGYTLLAANAADLVSGVSAAMTVVPTTHFSVSGLPALVTAGQSVSVTVSALTATNQIDTSYQGTIHLTSSDPQAVLPADYTFAGNDHGKATLTVTLKSAGKETVTATETSKSTATGTSAAVNVVAAATVVSLGVTAFPMMDITGVAHAFTVTALDAYGNKVSGYRGKVQLTSSDALAMLTPAVWTFTAGDAGSHLFVAMLNSLGGQSLTATDMANGTITGTEPAINVVSPATHFSVGDGLGTLTAGQQVAITVTALDTGNHADGLFGDTIHFASSDPQAGLPADYTFTNVDAGQRTFFVTLETAGNQKVTIADLTRPGINGVSPAIAVGAAAATTFIVSGFPSQDVSGVAHVFTVTARDAYGNKATGYRGTVQLSSSDSQAILTPASYSFTQGDAGSRSVSATLKSLGSQSLFVTDGTVSGSQPNVNVVSPTARLGISGAPAKPTAGQSFTITVTALTGGNQADGLFTDTIHFTSSDPEAILPPDYPFTAADGGKKSFAITLETAGSQKITVTDLVRPTITGAASGIAVAAAAASSLSVTGYSSPTLAGAGHGVTVTALDAFGNKATSYRGTVLLTSTDGQAVVPGPYTFTSADGGAHTFNVTLNTVGFQTLTATDKGTPSITGAEANIDVAHLGAAISGPASSVRGQPLAYALTASEDGEPAGTSFTYKIDWNGDGSVVQTVSGPSGLTASHVFPSAGNFTTKVKVVDSAGNVSSVAMQPVAVKALLLETDPGDVTKTALVIGGTTASDTITITPADPTGSTVGVLINGVLQGGGPFAPTGHIIVYGQAGNDVIQIAAAFINMQPVTVAIPALLFAGAGGDTLSVAGSSANNILVGGAGNNKLTGGSGRDILIGGGGASVLHAGSGGDVLIAGSTIYNANLAALLALSAEWGRADGGYQDRVHDLFGDGSGGLNGSYFLNAASVIRDTAVSQLYGGTGSDWFWIAAGATGGDQLKQVAVGDVVTFE